MKLEGMKTYKLSELIDLIGGGTPKTNVSEYWNGNIPWLSVVDFGKITKHVFFTEKRITEKGLKESSTKLIKKGSLIISARGTVGELAMLGEDMAFNQSCYGINAKDITTNNYLFYLIKHNINQLKSKTHGAVFDTITKQTFDNIEVTIPIDLLEQSRIASILSSLDDKIELNLQTNKTLEAIAQAIFKEWFVDFRFPGFDGELVDGLPKAWRKATLAEAVFVKGGSTPSTIIPEFWDGLNFWATPKDLSDLKSPVLLSTERRISDSGLKQISSGVLPKGTLLLSSRAPIGYLAINQIPVSINQGFIAIQGKLVSNLFMLLWLRRNMDLVKGRANGSTFQEISKSNFKGIGISIPHSDLLNNFDQIVKAIFERIVANEKENQTLIQIRDVLLPKLMTGKLRVA